MSALQAREIDFVSRFSRNWKALSQILGIMRPIRKAPGTQLKSLKVEFTTLEDSPAEGEEIPYSKPTYTPVAFQDLTVEKYAEATSIEAVAKYGAKLAVQKTDDAFLTKLQTLVMTRFYTFLATGQLTNTAATFQAAIAKAIGSVLNAFQTMNKDVTSIVVFVNTLDLYDYLGNAPVTIQNEFGLQYIKNFLGAETVIVTDKVARGTVIATPVENIDLYYIDPNDADFHELGLEYRVEGETNLIGFHAQGDYSHAVGECYALMGMALWAEYLNAIAVVTVE
jgi:hypothetical protein